MTRRPRFTMRRMGSEPDSQDSLEVTAPPLLPTRIVQVVGAVAAVLLVLAVLIRSPGLASWTAFVALATGAIWMVDALRRSTARRLYITETELLVRGPLRSERFAWREVLAVRVRAISRTSGSAVERARQICLDLSDGRTVDLPIQGRTRDYGGRSLLFPDLLNAAEFDRVLANLRDLVAQHRP